MKSSVFLVGLVMVSVALGTFLMIYALNFRIQVSVPDYTPQLDIQLNQLLQIWNQSSTHELRYQDYITPFDSAVKQLSDNVNGKVEAYTVAVGWVWVSDATLNEVAEKWLMPYAFLVDTPYYPTNPAKPRHAGDCEEQANTLVSLLRAEGVEAENVRVVLGIVNARGTEGGHVWVEVYEDNRWLALEATAGPFYDDASLRLIERKGFPYDYYKTQNHPTVEIWFYYNDIYYVDFIHNKQKAPSHWLMTNNNISTNINERTQQLLITFYSLTWLADCCIKERDADSSLHRARSEMRMSCR